MTLVEQIRKELTEGLAIAGLVCRDLDDVGIVARPAYEGGGIIYLELPLAESPDYYALIGWADMATCELEYPTADLYPQPGQFVCGCAYAPDGLRIVDGVPIDDHADALEAIRAFKAAAVTALHETDPEPS